LILPSMGSDADVLVLQGVLVLPVMRDVDGCEVKNGIE
jgi:hypothetical protein